MLAAIKQLLKQYGLNADSFKIEAFGSGLINSTWRLSGREDYIFQQLNSTVFKEPEAIANNLQQLDDYLKVHAPDYLFVAPLKSLSGKPFVILDDQYFRLFPFVKNSVTLNTVETPAQAFEAAKQFGKFTRLLTDFDPGKLDYTLPKFHDLNLRYEQFEKAYAAADNERLQIAKKAINDVKHNDDILTTYLELITRKLLPLRVIHHDTKISNVLFDDKGKGLCVIDLDTVMPGYYISDVGDMMRTYLSPANEEEKDFDKIRINRDCLYAIYDGYMAEMGTILTEIEKQYFNYSGKYMVYMQAIRFLTDFLNGDVYFVITYPNQNLIRAQNQLILLRRLIEFESKL